MVGVLYLTHFCTSLHAKVKAVQQQKVSGGRGPANCTKVKLDINAVSSCANTSKTSNTSSSPPPRRLHSAGSSPSSTPVRTSAPSRHTLMMTVDDALASNSAPGGPPPPPSQNTISSPQGHPPASGQTQPSVQTTPVSLLRLVI